LSHNAEKVTWYFNGNEIQSDSSGYRLISDGVVQALQILKPEYEADGRYSVQADLAECATTMEVHGRPQMKEKEVKQIELDAHDTLTIRLPINSRPEPDVLLYLNGESLFADIRTNIELVDDLIVITRRAMRKADAGTYELKLSNDHGEEICEFKVTVNDVPEAPQHMYVTEVGHDYASVGWDKPIVSIILLNN
jgi:hypothetical protein